MRAELMFQSDMEALRAQPVPEGEAAASSVQVLTKVLSNSSSQNFLKNVGIKPVATKKSSSVVENELREQLAAAQQNSTAQQAELEALRKKSEEAEERLARTQQKMEEYKKSCDENNELMRRFFEMQKRGPSST
jgi:molecular chaperone GrpE (heat shock protein)